MTARARQPRGLALAVTGGVGCGKSEVGRLLAGWGAQVLDADEVARGLLQPGQPVYQAVVRHFGARILGAGGAVDRRALARLVFAEAGSREALNRLTHPAVLEEIRRWRAQVTAEGGHAAALVPLLFEAGAESGWDAVWCVSADAPVALERLLRRGWTAEEARARQGAQWPLAEKERRADRVIRNNGSLEDLEKATHDAWRSLVEQKER